MTAAWRLQSAVMVQYNYLHKAHSRNFLKRETPSGRRSWCLTVSLSPSSDSDLFRALQTRPERANSVFIQQMGIMPMLLKMGPICLSLIRLALSIWLASGVISLDKWTWKEWALCLSANLIQALCTTKSSRQRKSQGKFTEPFSPHWLLEWSTAGQSCAKEDWGYVWFYFS